ncbi:MAG: hypothetical protein Q8939_19565 [Bacteroidota bacterium]|nr:hypothetical protein [Bacteroidota bacterium]
MKKITEHLIVLIATMLFTGFTGITQSKATPENAKKNTNEMKTYVIERNMPGLVNSRLKN